MRTLKDIYSTISQSHITTEDMIEVVEFYIYTRTGKKAHIAHPGRQPNYVMIDYEIQLLFSAYTKAKDFLSKLYTNPEQCTVKVYK